MRKSARILFVVAFLFVSSPHRTSAEPAQQVPVGIRAQGMGGAYTSLSDDASALFWNPAGLAGLGHEEISATHADLYGTGIVDNLAAFALPLSLNSAAAVDWYHSGFGDGELDFGETRIDLAYARRVMPWLAVGATGKYLNRDIALDGADVRKGNGVGADFGLIATPWRSLRLGFLAQDAFDTRISYSDGNGSALAFPRRLRAGASYAPIQAATIAFDVDDRWHLGVEGRPITGVALRAGLQDEPDDPSGVTWSAGAGFKANIFRVDYALVEHPTLGTTSHFGVALEFNFNPSRVRIEKVEPKYIYASLHQTYARDPVAKVLVRNLDDEALEAKIRVQVPGIMIQPSESTVVLPPRVVTEINTTAVIPPSVMALHDSRPVQVEVTASYQSARLVRSDKSSSKTYLYAPRAIDWNLGVAQAAAFVTAGDPVVSNFAGQATRSAALTAKPAPVDRNLIYTAAIVDALAAIKFAYVPDQNRPYSAISPKEGAFDTIAYPRETLQRRVGDCDDTSILLATLLESVGIATRLVAVPGHLFILADTGVHERNVVGLGFDESRTVVVDRRVWIPLETTSLNEGFAKAWSDGSKTYQASNARGEVETFDVEDALHRYAPALPPFTSDAAPSVDGAVFESRLGGDLQTMNDWRDARVRGLRPDTGRTSVAAALELARINLQAGSFPEATRILSEALSQNPRHPAVVANLGAVLAAQGNLGAAASRYEEAISLDGSDPGLWLNLGLIRIAAGDSVGAARPLAEGVRRSGGYERACDLLSLEHEDSPTKEGTRHAFDSGARRLLQDALRSATRQAPPGRPEQGTRTLGDVQVGPSQSALLEHLYWKDIP